MVDSSYRSSGWGFVHLVEVIGEVRPGSKLKASHFLANSTLHRVCSACIALHPLLVLRTRRLFGSSCLLMCMRNSSPRSGGPGGSQLGAMLSVWCLLVLGSAAEATPSFSDYSGLMGGRPSQPTCVDIPKNMSLCHGIGYNKMRLPNLLDHDTMAEVSQQAGSWVPLLNVRCHPDTQLFLCSLFSPVCLDRPIYPCRSLCDKVKLGCEGRMKTYGFPWPDMFKCDKFPLDNDMCITPQSKGDSSHDQSCQVCNQVETYENILDNFCRADFAVRAKIRRVWKARLTCKKGKVLKGSGEMMRQLRRPVITLQPSDLCCEDVTRNKADAFLIMGHRREGKLLPSFIMPLGKQSKPFKRAVRMFKKLNCSDPRLVSHSVIGDAFSSGPGAEGVGGPSDANGRRKRGRTKGQKQQKHPNQQKPPKHRKKKTSTTPSPKMKNTTP